MKRWIGIGIIIMLIAGSAWLVWARQEAVTEAEWQVGASMPTARSEVTAAAWDGRIVVIGGLAGAAWTRWQALDTVEVYDVEQDRWESAAPLPRGLHHTAAAAAGGRVYVAGGYDDPDFTADVREMWVYDPETDSWQEAPPMPGPRAAHVMVTIDEKMYVVGGVGPRSAQIWVFDTAQQAWEDSGITLPTPREHLAAVNWEGLLVVIAGRDFQSNLGVVEAYNPADDSWQTLPPLNLPRSGFTAGVLDGVIHVTGGESLTSGNTFPTHEIYDAAAQQWVMAPSMPTARHGLSSAVVQNRWFVIGGSGGAGGRTLATLGTQNEIFVVPDGGD